MNRVVVDQDQYYNDKLLDVVKDILSSFKEFTEAMYFTVYEGFTGYAYMMSKTVAEGSYTYAELQKWMDAGDLVDAIETYHNVHKSIYGIRPRIGNTEDWADINWVREQTRDCIAAEDSYLDYQEHMND